MTRFAVLAISLLPILTVQAATTTDELSAYDEQATRFSSQLLKQLGGKLKQAMKTSGPVEAIKVCKEHAPEIALNISLQHDIKIGRVGTRVRNNFLGTPDAWEQEQLQAFEKRKAGGESLDEMKVSTITTDGDKHYYRFMKPMGTKQICLTCHGDDSTIPDSVRAELERSYPHDKATQYKAGDLRGAVSIKQLVVAE